MKNVKIEFSPEEAETLMRLCEMALKYQGDSVVDSYVHFKTKFKMAFGQIPEADKKEDK